MPRVIAFSKSGSAYEKSFYRALEATGCKVVYGEFGGKWLLDNLECGDVVHFHWPSFSYAESRSKARAVLRFLRFVLLALLCRIRGGRIVWTAHNLLPHDPNVLPVIDVAARHFVIGLAEKVLVHGYHAGKELVSRFPAAKGKIMHIPHGNWVDEYSAEYDRVTARAKFGLDSDCFVYLFFGFCKPYKNLDGLLRSFGNVKGAVRLIIAGKFQDSEYERLILELAEADPRVKVVTEFVADGDVPLYFMAADAFVVPYREILTSGSAVLAMGFGCPIISVRQGFLIDIVDCRSGILFERDRDMDMDEALRRVRDVSWDRSYIRDRIRKSTFEEAAAVLHKIVGARDLLRNRLL